MMKMEEQKYLPPKFSCASSKLNDLLDIQNASMTDSISISLIGINEENESYNSIQTQPLPQSKSKSPLPSPIQKQQQSPYQVSLLKGINKKPDKSIKKSPSISNSTILCQNQIHNQKNQSHQNEQRELQIYKQKQFKKNDNQNSQASLDLQQTSIKQQQYQSYSQNLTKSSLRKQSLQQQQRPQTDKNVPLIVQYYEYNKQLSNSPNQNIQHLIEQRTYQQQNGYNSKDQLLNDFTQQNQLILQHQFQQNQNIKNPLNQNIKSSKDFNKLQQSYINNNIQQNQDNHSDIMNKPSIQISNENNQLNLSDNNSENYKIQQITNSNVNILDHSKVKLLIENDSTNCIQDFLQNTPIDTFTQSKNKISNQSMIPPLINSQQQNNFEHKNYQSNDVLINNDSFLVEDTRFEDNNINKGERPLQDKTSIINHNQNDKYLPILSQMQNQSVIYINQMKKKNFNVKSDNKTQTPNQSTFQKYQQKMTQSDNDVLEKSEQLQKTITEKMLNMTQLFENAANQNQLQSNYSHLNLPQKVQNNGLMKLPSIQSQSNSTKQGIMYRDNQRIKQLRYDFIKLDKDINQNQQLKIYQKQTFGVKNKRSLSTNAGYKDINGSIQLEDKAKLADHNPHTQVNKERVRAISVNRSFGGRNLKSNNASNQLNANSIKSENIQTSQIQNESLSQNAFQDQSKFYSQNKQQQIRLSHPNLN